MVLVSRLKVILWAVPTMIMINDAVVSIAMCKDEGMQPTIRRGDLVLVDRMVPIRNLQPGNVVLMRNPEAPRGASDVRLIRRLENKNDYSTRYGKFQYGRDSADFGPVPEAIILGRVLAVIFPPWRAGWMTDKKS
jgi:signal peptidase I